MSAPLDLGPIEAAFDATGCAGPWEASGRILPPLATFDEQHNVYPTGDERGPICEASSEARAKFIAAMSVAVPAMVTEIETLRAALAEACAEFDDALSYKLDYLIEKHGDKETLARLRALLPEAP